jgi:hypothetical protein
MALGPAIDRLYALRRRPGYEHARTELMAQLAREVQEDPESILGLGEQLLRNLNNTDPELDHANFGLHLLFDFFESRRLTQIRSLVERALQSSRFRMKERYIQTLEELGDPASVPALLAVLSLHRDGGIEAEDVRVAVLNALAGYFPPLADPSPVLELLPDDSPRVRAAALRYLLSHAVAAPPSMLAMRARNERDPELLDLVFELFERADPARALAAAEARLSTIPPSEAEIIESLQRTVKGLRERDDHA